MSTSQDWFFLRGRRSAMKSPVLALHIAAGISGLVSGTLAMCFRKGSDRHRLYGNLFVVSMLALGTSAAVLAIYAQESANLIAGVFTVYLVGTAWATARSERRSGILDWIGLAFILVLGGVVLLEAIQAVRTPTPDGAPAAMLFFVASIALLCAVGDIRMVARGGISGTPRIARHLWRMCFGLFIASGSFFLGRIRIFPHFIRELYVPGILGFLPLLLMIYWLVRVRVTRRLKTRSAVQAA